MSNTILSLEHLNVSFIDKVDKKENKVISDISLNVEEGKILGIVGESGSGKSVTMMSVLRLLSNSAKVSGKIMYDGKDLLTISKKELQKIRGGEISVVFQDPMTTLNPVFTIGNQLREVIKLHRPDVENPNEYLIELLSEVGISDGKTRLKQYPHELSGGQRQRIVIAMALAGNPKILIADEPTTALDVTIQAQILDLIKDLTVKRNMTTVMITHDLGVVANICDNVAVLYGGKIYEMGTTREILKDPKNEYTKGLIAAMPGTSKTKRLVPIEGVPANRNEIKSGCAFCSRCKNAMEICLTDDPLKTEFSQTHAAWCWVNYIPEGKEI